LTQARRARRNGNEDDSRRPRERQPRHPAGGLVLAVGAFEEHHARAPDRQEVLGMCEDWWMWRRHREAEEARRLWDEFDRTQPVSEPERVDEREVTLEQREATPTAAES
jgi:hypothetical protein